LRELACKGCDYQSEIGESQDWTELKSHSSGGGRMTSAVGSLVMASIVAGEALEMGLLMRLEMVARSSDPDDSRLCSG